MNKIISIGQILDSSGEEQLWQKANKQLNYRGRINESKVFNLQVEGVTIASACYEPVFVTVDDKSDIINEFRFDKALSETLKSATSCQPDLQNNLMYHIVMTYLYTHQTENMLGLIDNIFEQHPFWIRAFAEGFSLSITHVFSELGYGETIKKNLLYNAGTQFTNRVLGVPDEKMQHYMSSTIYRIVDAEASDNNLDPNSRTRLAANGWLKRFNMWQPQE